NQHRQSAVGRDSSKFVFGLPRNPFLNLSTRVAVPVLHTGPNHSGRSPFSSYPSPYLDLASALRYLASALRFGPAWQCSVLLALAASPPPSSPPPSPSYPRNTYTPPPLPPPCLIILSCQHRAVRTNHEDCLLVRQLRRAPGLAQIPSRATPRPVTHRRGIKHLPIHHHVVCLFGNQQHVPVAHRHVRRGISPQSQIRLNANHY